MMTVKPAPILILGASGYIGRHLVTRLSRQGQQVIAASRHIDSLAARHLPDVRCEYVDLMKSHTLPEGLWQAETLYYLVHSMGDGADFLEREYQSAQNLRQILRTSNVRQIIYLGSAQTSHTRSVHMQARKLTGDVLRSSGIPVTELRAGIIIGAGSAAFEIMRDMVNNLPVLTPPRWVRSKSSPVALENLLTYLTDIRHHPDSQHRIFDVAGPEYLSYQDLFARFIRLTGKRRLLVPLPLPTGLVSAWFLHLVTSVCSSTARALVQGLRHDLPMDDRALRRLIPQRLIGFDEAVRATLADENAASHHPDWGLDPDVQARWQPEYSFYPKQAGCSYKTQASSQTLWQVVQQVGGQEGYFYANWLWQLRARIDDWCGNQVIYSRPMRAELFEGDVVNGWKVIRAKPCQQLVLLFGMKAPGLGRLAFTIDDRGTYRMLDVRAWWHPAGAAGLGYWFAMMPAHLFIFRGMARRIATLAQDAEQRDVTRISSSD
ncbi:MULTISPECIES: DUF2867 domain-containing protein [Dickeya]|uniref:Conserved protein with NAD(P)-binding Rossmann-fold domain, YbjT plays a role in promoting the stress-induced mutagenesis (SIM) response of E. coli K-12 n=1 Tax=Dickeya aquatica TaxID=1401087 RepID=A0A375ABK9_9GAMM|nr:MULTISPECIES: DUF2867 domain-containing protein [Dickeya]SLM62969.1 conserved protein with NAD(P)-binding Rossmann-fold domain, YbjT plays a role in promoting the stress-induced mutagenesis (SIM) response of E. coli K-12 [Dickeya aquatica]